jgi:hypothetical protein
MTANEGTEKPTFKYFVLHATACVLKELMD